MGRGRLLGALGLLTALSLKTSRPDGERVGDVHPYRQILPFIMRGRNESMVLAEVAIPADPLLDYISQAKARFEVDITHCLVAASAVALAHVPKMNRFISGQRLYQRDARQLTFSMKRRAKDAQAKLSAVKLTMQDQETFYDLCARINGAIQVERSGERTYVDRELSLLKRIPKPLMNAAVALLRALDNHHLLPGAFIEGDAMFTSIFIANLGSLGMSAVHHHLYEWGNCPVFICAGAVEMRPVVDNGQVVARRVLPLKITYDERIDDAMNARAGLDIIQRVLQNPQQHLGCLLEDGSDARPLIAPLD